ncbi:MAG: signal peptidase I [Clostridia bacterium]
MYKLPKKHLIVLRIVTYVTVFLALICSLVAGFFVIYIRVPVNGLSMYPTLNSSYQQTKNRDYVYINRFADVNNGDIVVLDLRKYDAFGDYAIKRLVAVEGDIVNITYDSNNMQYNLIVNNKIIDYRPYQIDGYNTFSCFEQYVHRNIDDETRVVKNESGEVKGINIKQGEIFVLGDNWETSNDSSRVGPLKYKDIVGRVDMIIKPNENELISVFKRIF